jgi:Flp pilus assembly pilin Flp
MGATEYTILLVLAAVVVIAVVSRFGRTVGGNVEVARKSVEKLGQDQNGHSLERRSDQTLGVDDDGHIVERSTSSGAGASLEALPDAIEKPSDAKAKRIDARFAIFVGVVSVAVLMLVVLGMGKRARKSQ